MEHQRRKKKIKTSTVVKIVVIILLVAAILAGVIYYLRNRVRTEYGNRSNASIESAAVESGSISTTVYGTGRLQDDDTQTQTVPDGGSMPSNQGSSFADGDFSGFSGNGSAQSETGLSDGTNVQIVSGLQAGQSVYYRYADSIEYSFVRPT